MLLKEQEKVRILIVSQHFWPEGFHINDVARSLVAQGHTVDVLTAKPNYPEGRIFTGYRAWGCQQEDYHGVTIRRMPLFPRGKDSKVRLALNYLSFIFSGYAFGPWLTRGQKYDVIFVYGVSPILQALPALLLGWLKKSPVVIWVQDLWPESLSATGYVKNRFILKAVEKVVRFIYHHTDLLLVQSRAFIAPVRKLAPRTPIQYHPNSVDESFAKPAMPASHPEVPALDAPFTVMFAGNIGAAQAVEVIVEAAALLKAHSDIHFIVLGDGSRREWMLQQVRQQGLANLHLPGRFPVETMPGFMQKASVLLVTLADREIFAATVPSKVQAYLAAGRPIIASLNGAGADLVAEAGAGLTAPAEDGTLLAKAVMTLYTMSTNERCVMGERGRCYYQAHFTHEKLIGELIQQLEQTVHRTQGHTA
ncbi:glycosyltransferase family 4 protein [Leeia aquatica]|uniref:glycosyltransferase family 4 protein n=1 Tax=Leeia aquatica TaxID=2725557 RepID=UPI00197D4B96|nr:glycosyltransferase family 4 protein [Leeia aquatica]